MKPHQTDSNRLRTLAALAAFAILLGAAVPTARGENYINWNGNDASGHGNFSYCDNWYYSTCPTWAYGTEVDFSYVGNDGSGYDDLGGWVNIDNIIFDSSFAGAWTWSTAGNGINFNAKIENDSSYTQTWNIPTSGSLNGAGSIQLNPVSGNLILGSPVYNDNAVEYQVYGQGSHQLVLNADLVGGVSGKTGVAMNMEDLSGYYSVVDVKAAQTWGGSSWIYINSGELWIDSGGSLASGQQVQVGDGGGNNNISKLWLTSTYLSTFANNITVYGYSGLLRVIGGLNSSGNNTLSGNITLNYPVSLIANASGGTVKFSGVISGSGEGVTIAAGTSSSGTVVLSGANTYSGGTTINSGPTLQLGAANTIPGNTIAGDVTDNGILDLNTYSDTINGLNGSGTVNTVAGGTPTLTVGANGDSGTFSGVIKNTAGTLALTKSGSGTETLSGANTYSGVTTISAGTLYGSASGSIPGNVTVSAGTLELGNASAMSSGATLNLASSPASGAVNLNFSGTQTISALNFGSTSMAQGTWGASGAAHNNAAFTGSGLLNVTSGGTSQTITFPNPGTQTYGVAPITLTASAPGGTVTYTVTSGPATVSGSTLTITGAGSVTVQANQSGTTTYNAAAAVNQTFTVNKAALTVTGASVTPHVYDGTENATITGAALSGVLSGDTGNVTLGNATSGTFAQSTVGTGISVATAMTISGSASGNYSLTQPTLTGNITKAALTVTGASVAPHVYDGTENATITGATLSGVLSGDTGNVTLGNATSGTFAQSTVGTGISVATAMTISGSASGNYSLTQPTLTGNITMATTVINTPPTASAITYGQTLARATLSGGSATPSGGLFAFTSPSFVPPSGVTAYSVTYTPLDTNDYTAASTTVNVTVNPAITTETTNQTVCAGSVVTWTVAASGTSLTYQWQREGTNLVEGADNFTGTTNATLTNSEVAVTDAQDTNVVGQGYACVISSGSCSVSSTLVSLAVNPLPTVSVNSATVCAGSSATLTATNSASNPSYLWSDSETTASITVSPASTTAYTVTVTDGTTGCANSGSGTVTVNASPVAPANGVTINVAPTLEAMINIATVLSSWQGAGLSLQSAGPGSTAGGTVFKDATYIYYIPPSGTITSDSIPYTVANAGGCTTAASITLTFVPQGGIAQGITLSGGNPTINFAGIPGFEYDVQRSTDLVTWTTLETIIAPSDGVFSYTDNSPPGGNAAYYRLMQQ